ncbi:alpha-ketoglutarate-dependent dioxygenase ABH4-like protein, partial [Sarcoptes scabiei]
FFFLNFISPLRGSSIDPHFDDFWIWGERLVTLNLQSTAIITLNLPDSYDHCIRIKCPNRSLLVLYGDARYRYHHSIRRSDITDRRIAITFRELPFSFYSSEEPQNHQIMSDFMRCSQFLITPSQS